MRRSLSVKGVRVVGVDDGRFNKSDEKVSLFALVMQDYKVVDLKVTDVQVDGLDVTEAIKGLLSKMYFDVVMLSGVCFAGFNIVNIQDLYEFAKKPILIITGDKPNAKAIRRALMLHFDDWRIRWSLIKKCGKIRKITTSKNYKPIYYEALGIEHLDAVRLIRDLTLTGRFPEPIRVARLISKQLTRR
ncbi:MAG: DUF99 family protein [Candidatus Bathyarchaeia archaeon]